MQLQTLRRAVARMRVASLPSQPDGPPGVGALRIVAAGRQLQFATCTQDVSSRVTVPAIVSSSGSVTVPAQPVVRFAGAADSDRVTICHDAELGGLRAEAGSLVAHIPAFGTDPWVGALGDRWPMSYPASDLMPVRRVLFACEPRSSVRGVRIGHNLAVATDTFRLAEVELDAPFDPVVVPRSILDHVFDSGPENIQSVVARSWIHFMSDEAEWSSPTVHAPFPAYEDIFDREPVATMVAERSHLLMALNRVHRVIGESAHRAVFLRGGRDGEGRVWSVETQQGSALEELHLTSTADRPLCFNIRYLLHLLHALTQRNVTFEMLGFNSAVVVRERNFRSIIMPIRTRESED